MHNNDTITSSRTYATLSEHVAGIAAAADGCSRMLVRIADRLPPDEVEVQAALSELCRMIGAVADRLR